eukprot:SAG31_NODE_1367_length_8615_cov_12.875763_11_plen_108_part_00
MCYLYATQIRESPHSENGRASPIDIFQLPALDLSLADKISCTGLHGGETAAKGNGVAPWYASQPTHDPPPRAGAPGYIIRQCQRRLRVERVGQASAARLQVRAADCS